MKLVTTAAVSMSEDGTLIALAYVSTLCLLLPGQATSRLHANMTGGSRYARE